MNNNMFEFGEAPKDVVMQDWDGKPLKAGDRDRRFFEASWMHKYDNKYYSSYSTGATHFIAYAIGNNPYGPFTYQEVIQNPVRVWINHHAIIQYQINAGFFIMISNSRARCTCGI